MTQTIRTTFQDELVKLQALVLSLAKDVSKNGELLLRFLEKRETVSEVFSKIKEEDKVIDKTRWDIHDFGDQLIVLQQPVAKDFRQIMTSVQITDNLERIGDHFKKIARLLEKSSLNQTDIPEEVILMAKLSLRMLSESTKAYSEILDGKTNEIAQIDDEVDMLYKQTLRKVIGLIKNASDEKIESITKLFFVARDFERAADHAAKIGQLVNFAVTGKRA